MFPNLIGQKGVKDGLTKAITTNQLAPAMLFYGPSYSGKLTAALELARTLSCSQKAAWQCDCRNCAAARKLLSPYTVMLGSRYFKPEIQRTGETFLANQSPIGLILYQRTVRKLLRRFDSFLWEDDDSRFKKAKPLILPLAEQLDSLDLTNTTNLANEIEAINAKAFELAGILDNYAVNIGQIRRLSSWARSNAQNNKIVIIEEADKIGVAAGNALLKILEEPSEKLYFILIAKERQSLMETIVSRVRPYHFTERSAADEAEALSRIFKTTGSSLQQFFVALPNLNELAASFYNGYKTKQNLYSLYPKELDDYFAAFLSEIVKLIQDDLLCGRLSIYEAEEFNAKLNRAKQQYTVYRQSPQSLAEWLFYS
ncbi:MAG: hypothetical protein FWE37_02720 [Spirochaetaceae bacterium]|nr:hypothetical protein [Spirochaetaceae bacterium]